MKKKLVIITGAGISAESGISTFRDSNGLWNNYRIEDVASLEGWIKDPKLVLDFYNKRRRQLEYCQPNAGHIGLKGMERDFDVHIITQNIDDLHERAGSTNVLHLHGELTKACDEFKTIVKNIFYNDINLGDQLGNTQMRPFIVWFGEPVPAIEEAIQIVQSADIVVVIGSSLQVYPAAGLVDYTPDNVPIYLIDPQDVPTNRNIHFIHKCASEGVTELWQILKNKI